MIELLPCPFCNADKSKPQIIGQPHSRYVCCCSCGAATDNFTVESEAIAAWNTRATVQRTCTWTEDETGDYWEGSCGATWVFGEGGAIDNMKYCPVCGGVVTEHEASK